LFFGRNLPTTNARLPDADFHLVILKEKTVKLPLDLFSQALITSSKNLQTSAVVTSHQKRFKPKSARFFNWT